ncbi:unnamed protein product [Darwinula stevensoni]|uniref:Alkaline ceramidase n=1 Tax=Darwinula stevensoni TaxID=69355 RepID=A0A7R8XLM2_9CRUS|nr:unnamed protein product [Darwinula stevensoni]CAG0894418.1 unnamed protein product [Darwinula stevensoni]
MGVIPSDKYDRIGILEVLEVLEVLEILLKSRKKWMDNLDAMGSSLDLMQTGLQIIWPLRPGTSKVDWCEDNYTFSPIVAELVNTVSNLLFLLLPPLLIFLFQPYGKLIQKEIHIIWILLFVIGAASAYFHATLSLLGQLLDELSILWAAIIGTTIWFPSRLLPNKLLLENRRLFRFLVAGIGLVCSVLCCIHPPFNAFALLSLVTPGMVLLYGELRRCHDSRVVRLGIRSTITWVVAIMCWINDRVFCDVWSSVQFPYLHGAWHILVCIAGYCSCVLFAYFYAVEEFPHRTLTLEYWPSPRFPELFSVPYINLNKGRLQKIV